jgi:hypothetical protein
MNASKNIKVVKSFPLEESGSMTLEIDKIENSIKNEHKSSCTRVSHEQLVIQGNMVRLVFNVTTDARQFGISME